MKLFLWEILVPRNDNNGKDFPVSYHRLWDNEVVQIAGGLTIMKPTKGRWVDIGKELYIDRMIPVRILCTKKQIVEIVKFTALHYVQKAIMYFKVSEEVQIYEP